MRLLKFYSVVFIIFIALLEFGYMPKAMAGDPDYGMINTQKRHITELLDYAKNNLGDDVAKKAVDNTKKAVDVEADSDTSSTRDDNKNPNPNP